MDTEEQCPQCGLAYRGGTVFCVRCGARRASLFEESSPSESVSAESAAEPVSAPIDPRPLALHYVAQLFGLMLLMNLPIAVLGYASDHSSLVTIVASIAQLIVVMGFLVMRPQHLRVALTPTLGIVRTLLATGLALVTVFLWMWGYFTVAHALGVPTLSCASEIVSLGLPLTILLNSVMPAVVEETAFRGLMQRELQVFVPESQAVLLQAIAFGIMHLAPIVFVSHVGFGLLLGVLRQRTGSVLPGMVIHALWNLAVTLDDARLVALF